MLQIEEFTEATLASLTPRNQKHGDDNVPALSLGLMLEVANTLLDAIDPDIRAALYKRHDGQDDLPGVEPSTPVLRCNSIGNVKLETKYEGWTLEVDDGIDETTPKVFGGCKVDAFSVEPKQGGTCVLRLRVGTSDIDAERSGLLAMHIAQSIWIKLRAPLRAEDGGPDENPEDPDSDDEQDADMSPGEALFGDNLVEDEQPVTAGEVFANAVERPANNTVVTIRRSRLSGKLGTDADQARRQAEALAADDARTDAA